MYSCPKCRAMKRPEKTPSLLKGSVATPSLVAGIMNAKYVNGMPLARQEREFARYDLNLSTKTMANWIIQCAGRYLQPLYDLMKEELLWSKYLHGDETRIQVLDERTRRVPPRTGCGSISRMNTAAPRRWSSSSTKGPVPDTIRRIPWRSVRRIFYLRWVPGIPQSSREDHRDGMHGPCETQI